MLIGLQLIVFEIRDIQWNTNVIQICTKFNSFGYITKNIFPLSLMMVMTLLHARVRDVWLQLVSWLIYFLVLMQVTFKVLMLNLKYAA